MKTKKAFAFLLALTFIFSLGGCAERDERTELILADSTGKGAAGQLFNEYLSKRVSELTGGSLVLVYHPNGELGGDTDLLRQIQAGDIDMVLCQMAPVVSFIPETAVFDLPMVFSKYSGDSIEKVLNGSGEFRARLDEAYDRAGFRLLGFLQNGTYRLTTANSPLDTLEDFEHLQIRTMENRNHMAFWSAIGAEPTPLAWAEVYFALQSGTIDAQENAADTCVGANLNEVQKYLACTDHILYLNQLCMNADSFASLSEEHRQAIVQAVRETTELMRPRLLEADAKSKQLLTDSGMSLIEYDSAFYDSILALSGVRELYDRIDTEVNGLGKLLTEELEGCGK